MNRFLITVFEGMLLCGLWNETRPLAIDLFRRDEILQADSANAAAAPRQGDIYAAKVKNILRAQQAAFCDVLPGFSCYLPLDRGSVLYTDGSRSEKDCSDLREGAEVIVQIAKDAHGRKNPVLSGYFDLAEFDDPREEIRRIIGTAKTRTCYSRIYRAPSMPVRQILGLNAEELEMIRTDDAEIFETLKSDPFLRDAGLDKKVSLYTDDYPLAKLYSVRSGLEEALSPRVRMRSGIELVIEHTEAFWAVDVNTAKNGRAAKGQSKEEAVLSANLEAAEELAVQLRLRNMSGIVVVDFINMTKQESRDAVAAALAGSCADDPAGVHPGGFTPFGLFELSRKRIRPALYEQYSAMHGNALKNKENP